MLAGRENRASAGSRTRMPRAAARAATSDREKFPRAPGPATARRRGWADSRCSGTNCRPVRADRKGPGVPAGIARRTGSSQSPAYSSRIAIPHPPPWPAALRPVSPPEPGPPRCRISLAGGHRRQHQTAIDGAIFAAAPAVRDQHHGTRAALAFRAAFFRAGQTLGANIVEQGSLKGNTFERNRPIIENELRAGTTRVVIIGAVDRSGAPHTGDLSKPLGPRMRTAREDDQSNRPPWVKSAAPSVER